MKNGLRSRNRLTQNAWEKLGAYFHSQRVCAGRSLKRMSGSLHMNEVELAAFEKGNGVSEWQLVRINHWLAENTFSNFRPEHSFKEYTADQRKKKLKGQPDQTKESAPKSEKTVEEPVVEETLSEVAPVVETSV